MKYKITEDDFPGLNPQPINFNFSNYYFPSNEYSITLDANWVINPIYYYSGTSLNNNTFNINYNFTDGYSIYYSIGANNERERNS